MAKTKLSDERELATICEARVHLSGAFVDVVTAYAVRKLGGVELEQHTFRVPLEHVPSAGAFLQELAAATDAAAVADVPGLAYRIVAP